MSAGRLPRRRDSQKVMAARLRLKQFVGIVFVLTIAACSSQARIQARQAKIQARTEKNQALTDLMQAKTVYANCLQTNSAKPEVCDGYKRAYAVNLETCQALGCKQHN
jgi:hypothetical protein